MEKIIRQRLEEHRALVAQVLEGELGAKVAEAAAVIKEALSRGNKVLLCGNGGSAADSQHIAAELVGRFRRERRGLAAVALTVDTSILTAVGNDYGFEKIFARQVEALGHSGDVLIGFSTSGSSPNVLRAVELAKSKDMYCIGMTGAGGGEMAELCDICLSVPSVVTARIQEIHIIIGHILCELTDGE